MSNHLEFALTRNVRSLIRRITRSKQIKITTVEKKKFPHLSPPIIRLRAWNAHVCIVRVPSGPPGVIKKQKNANPRRFSAKFLDLSLYVSTRRCYVVGAIYVRYSTP